MLVTRPAKVEPLDVGDAAVACLLFAVTVSLLAVT
jgi:hypothetical protein